MNCCSKTIRLAALFCRKQLPSDLGLSRQNEYLVALTLSHFCNSSLANGSFHIHFVEGVIVTLSNVAIKSTKSKRLRFENIFISSTVTHHETINEYEKSSKNIQTLNKDRMEHEENHQRTEHLPPSLPQYEAIGCTWPIVPNDKEHQS